jgi:hypothetical protein
MVQPSVHLIPLFSWKKIQVIPTARFIEPSLPQQLPLLILYTPEAKDYLWDLCYRDTTKKGEKQGYPTFFNAMGRIISTASEAKLLLVNTSNSRLLLTSKATEEPNAKGPDGLVFLKKGIVKTKGPINARTGWIPDATSIVIEFKDHDKQDFPPKCPISAQRVVFQLQLAK